jgi:peroxiredoxin
MKALPSASSPSSYFAPGDKAPFFELVDPIIGGTLRSSDLLRVGPVLLTFYRGAWCGCCSADLRDVTQSASLFRSRNVCVLGVFHDLSKEANIRIRETYNLEFPLVDDPNGRAAQAFGIRRSACEMAEIENSFGPELLALKEGQPWIMPMQARYLIRPDGVIAHSELVIDYVDRSSLTNLRPLLEAL